MSFRTYPPISFHFQTSLCRSDKAINNVSVVKYNETAPHSAVLHFGSFGLLIYAPASNCHAPQIDCAAGPRSNIEVQISWTYSKLFRGNLEHFEIRVMNQVPCDADVQQLTMVIVIHTNNVDFFQGLFDALPTCRWTIYWFLASVVAPGSPCLEWLDISNRLFHGSTRPIFSHRL